MPALSARRFFAVLCLLAGAAGWGIIWYPYRVLNQAGVSGLASSLISYALPLLLLGWLHRRALWGDRDKALWLAALGLSAGWTNIAYVIAVLGGEIMRVLLLFYLAPLWTVLFARWLLREKLTPAGWLVMALSLAGAASMLWPPQGGFPLPQNAAEWLALSAGMTFALSNVITRRIGQVANGSKAVAVWGGVTALALLALVGKSGQWDFAASAGMATWGWLLVTAALIAGMTYAVQWGLSHTPANQAIIILLFELVVAAIASYVLAGETMSGQELVGAALIVAASLFSGKLEQPHA